MARPKNPALAVRNDRIYAEWRSGWSLAKLAEKYKRTPQVIGRIVAAYHPDLEDDTDRALHRGRLETLYEEVQSVVDAPGWKLAPNGRLAQDDDGNPLYDTGALIEALKLKLMVLESARKLDARDKPQLRQVQVQIDVAMQEKNAAVAARRREMLELTARAGQPAVVPGEVVRELEAVQQRGEERLRVPQLRQPDVLRLSREGQMSERTTWCAPSRWTNMAPAEAAKPFRAYAWRERERHPVVSPAAAAMLRTGTMAATQVRDYSHSSAPAVTP